MANIEELIVAERTDLVGVLAGLPPEQWDAATLCTGWRVREVVAHITMPYRYSMPKVLLGVLRAGGSFNRMADRAARRDTVQLTAEELVAVLRDNVHHQWKPPGGGFEAALSHDVIHGLDVTVPLGLDRRVPAERLRVALGGLDDKKLRYFGVDLDGVQLRATDLDWGYGSGAPLEGAAQDLLLVVCGRRLPAGQLSGAAAARFSAET